MISNMIYIRTSLELANESKKKIEAINAILMEKSETDELTGLANRYKLSEYSRTVMDECIQERKTLAVEILDVDYFKEYNDNYGHQAGDEFIIMYRVKKQQRNSRETASVWADFMSPMHN